MAQLDNIRQRLDNLRARQNPTVTEGLKVSYNGQALPSMGAFALAPTDKDGKPIPQKGGGASADQDPFERYGVFVVGDLDIGKVSGAGIQSGFDFRSHGISVGADYRFAGNHVFGVPRWAWSGPTRMLPGTAAVRTSRDTAFRSMEVSSPRRTLTSIWP